MNCKRSLVAFAAAGVCLAAAATAQALDCGGTMANNAGVNFTATPIYITGSTALEPMIKAFGPKLAQQAANPYVIIYLKDGSCAGVNRINGDGKIAAGTTMFYIPPDYDSTKTYNCNIATGGQVGDLVLSDVDAKLCPGHRGAAGQHQGLPGPGEQHGVHRADDVDAEGDLRRGRLPHVRHGRRRHGRAVDSIRCTSSFARPTRARAP